MKKLFILILMAVTAFNFNVYGYTLPDGSVQGLPQNLIVMDENGHSPDNGELFIHIENMIPFEVYEKDITLMNARNDAVYSIYMTATPNYSIGDIDLLGETVCRLWLDDELIYTGLVNGDGTPNMQENALDLGGVLKRGESRNLHAEFIWYAGLNEENDNDNSYYGEVSFHWTFFASVPTDPTPSDPSGGGGGGEHNPPPEDVVNKPGETVNSGDTPPNIPYPDIVPDDVPDNNPQDTPSDSVKEEYGGDDNPTPTPHIPPKESTDEGEDPSIIEDIINKIPVIPDDVKTGYMSQLVFYTKVAIVAFGFAFVIIILIIYNSIRLKRLKRNNQNIVRG